MSQPTPSVKTYWPVLIAALLLAPAMALYAYSRYQGSEVAMPIYAEYYLDAIAVVADQFRLALFDYPIMAKSYLITQSMSAGVVRLPITESWVVFSLIVFGFSLVYTSLSYYKGVGQYIVLGVLSLAIFGLKLNFLVQGAYANYAFIVALLVCTLSVYAVHHWLADAGFGKRWLVLGLPMLVLAAWYAFAYDTTDVAAAKVLATGGTTLFFATLGCLMVIAAGPMVWVYKLLTQSAATNASKNVSINLTVFALIYVVNLVLSLASNRWGLHIGLTVLGPSILFPLAVVAGWIGMQLAEPLYEEGSGSFMVMGRWLYTGLTMIALAFWGWAFVCNNDSLIRLLNDVLLVSQLAFTLMYLAYIYINFGGLFGQMPNLYKVLYKPVRMPFWAIWLGVVLGMFAYVKATSNVPILQYYSGLLNTQALVTYHQQDMGTAADLFELASQEDVGAQLSMFGKAAIAAGKYDHIKATDILIEGLEYKASPQAYLMLAQQYQDANRPKDQVATLYVARQFFPDHWAFCNNLALYYHQHQDVIKATDSVKHYLLLAKQLAPTHPILLANELALEAESGKVNLASATNSGPDKDMPYLNNLLAVANAQGSPLPNDIMLDYAADSTLHQLSFSYLYNYSINRVLADDTAAATIVKFYTKSPNAREFMKALNEAKAISYLRTGLRSKALRTLYSLSNAGQDAEYGQLYGQALAMSGSTNAALPFLQQAAMGVDYSTRAIAPKAILADPYARLLYAELSAINGQGNQAEALFRLIDAKDIANVFPIQPGHVSEAIAFHKLGNKDFSSLTVGGRVATLAYFAKSYTDAELTKRATEIDEPNIRLLALALIYPKLGADNQQFIINIAQSIIAKEPLEAKMQAAIAPLWAKHLAGSPNLGKLIGQSKDAHVQSVGRWAGLKATNSTAASLSMAEAWPLTQNVVGKAMDRLNAEGKRDLAYDLILNYLQYETNPPLWSSRLYVLQCFKLKLRSFASDQLRTYKARASAAEWAQLVTELKAIDPAYDGTVFKPIE